MQYAITSLLIYHTHTHIGIILLCCLYYSVGLAVVHFSFLCSYPNACILLFMFFIILLVCPSVVFPKIKPFTFGDTPVFAGQSAQVACSVSEGDSPLELSWTFDGPRDVFGLGVSVLNIGTKTSLLSIDNTDSVHRGNYTCRVTNRAGRASYTAGLNVHGTYLRLDCILARSLYGFQHVTNTCQLQVATILL